MSNVYYDPEKFGLTQVFDIDFSDGCYQFDYLVVWKDGDGRLYYAEDSGCSCPSPFDGIGMPELTRVQDANDILSRMHFRASEMYSDGERGRVAEEISQFASKARVGL